MVNLETRALVFGKRVLDFELVRRERKSIGIQVKPSGEVQVIAPEKSSEEFILLKVKQKARWIFKQQDYFLTFRPKTPPRQYLPGETHLYLGRQYQLAVVVDGTTPKEAIKLQRGKLTVTLQTSADLELQKAKVEKLIERFYREKASQLFNETFANVKDKFEKYQLPEINIQVRKMKTRWGSCSANGLILLNPALIKAPKASIEYVIMHELCHLVIRNHSKEFYILLERMMPDWKLWKDKLEYCLS